MSFYLRSGDSPKLKKSAPRLGVLRLGFAKTKFGEADVSKDGFSVLFTFATKNENQGVLTV